MSRIIELPLTDPRRIVATSNKRNIEKSVKYIEWRTELMRTGIVAAIEDVQVSVHEQASRTQWKPSYAAIDPGEGNEHFESPVLQLFSRLYRNQAEMNSSGVTRFRLPTSICSPKSALLRASTNARQMSMRIAARDGVSPSACCAT